MDFVYQDMADPCHIGLPAEVIEMPTIKVEQSLLKKLQRRHDIESDPELIADQLPLLGTDIDRCDDEMLEIEIFPDRPDLLSGETLAHAIRPFLHGTVAVPEMNIQQGQVKLMVDSSLKEIRPIILGAIVRAVDIGDNSEEKEEFIKILMEHQEKLHFALGRGRRRASIGVHDLGSLKPPFRVVSVPKEHSFIPLQMQKEMSISEILTSHEKGVEYAHLLDGFERFPVILDEDDAVLSFPPIINGDHTTVNHQTNDFFIDVTGWDQRACECSLLLICLQLQARGGIVESVNITDCDGQQFESPYSKAVVHKVPEELVFSILGYDFSDAELNQAINRMGGRFIGRETSEETGSGRMADASKGSNLLMIEMPRWRFDILHPIDLVEEIAIGHGYENLGEASPSHATTAIPLQNATFKRRLRDSLCGLGLTQVQSLTLSNEKDQFTFPRWQSEGSTTLISNPITQDHTMLRQSILPSLLRLLAANRHHELPQRIYEVGTTVRNHHNKDRVSWLCAENISSFANCRGMVQAFLRDLGGDSSSSQIEWREMPAQHGPWMKGRSSQIFINGEKVGEMGEIDPAVGALFELRVPLHGAEFSLQALMKTIPDPVL